MKLNGDFLTYEVGGGLRPDDSLKPYELIHYKQRGEINEALTSDGEKKRLHTLSHSLEREIDYKEYSEYSARAH